MLIQLDVLLIKAVEDEEKAKLDPPQRSRAEILDTIKSSEHKSPSKQYWQSPQVGGTG